MAPQPELLAYWQSLAQKHNLHANTVFHAHVVCATWNDALREWELVVEDVTTGIRTVTTARAVVSATGILSEPFVPEILGMRRFRGPLFHSARWNHSVYTRGKRIAVIGNGASAAQFVPCLVSDPTTHVVHICRTPNWYIYGPRGKYSAILRWILAHIPLALRLWRLWVIVVRLSRPYIQLAMQRLRGCEGGVNDIIEYMKRTAPECYHAQLIPSYPLQCRRPILDPGYLACLHQPNIELRWGEIKEIQEDGILMEGDVDVTPFDVIILGTGFITGKYFVSVSGSNGQTLEEYHKGQGGPSAYAGGVCVPGFPNYFFIGGPNTVTGNGSAVYTHECEVNYIVQLLRPLLCSPSCAARAASLTVLPAAHAAYNGRLQRAMAGPAYGGCPPSWFRVGGKNVSLWPWTHAWFWWVMRRVRWQDYELQAE